MTSSSRTTGPRSAETPMRVGARWRRRSLLFAVGATVAAALSGPAVASAGWSELDDLGNSTPSGFGSAPDSAASNGGGPGTGTFTQSEAGWTIPSEGDSCDWTVTGQLVVRNPTVAGLADGDPVEGVQVKVSGKASVGWYNEWETVTTDADGEFSVSHTECNDRSVKVEARFESDDDDLYVTGPGSHSWYQLHETGLNAPSEIELAVEPFGGESGEQSITQARTDAQTWIVYREALDRLADVGQPSLLDVTVHNPATLAPNGSWADPILHDIHIEPARTASIDTMLHELGHIWAYPREIGEGCLTSAVMPPPFGDGSFSTHDQVENPCVAFNEGFADFFSNKLEQDMNTEGLIASMESPDTTTPMNRATLNANGLVSLSSVATNELGWDQVFRVLTSPDITRDLFGPGFGNPGLVSTYGGPPCTGAGMPVGLGDLSDALRVIGYSGDQIDLQDSDDPSVAEVFDRAADRLAGFDENDAIAYLNAVDPTLESEPHDAYGC